MCVSVSESTVRGWHAPVRTILGRIPIGLLPQEWTRREQPTGLSPDEEGKLPAASCVKDTWHLGEEATGKAGEGPGVKSLLLSLLWSPLGPWSPGRECRAGRRAEREHWKEHTQVTCKTGVESDGLLPTTSSQGLALRCKAHRWALLVLLNRDCDLCDICVLPWSGCLFLLSPGLWTFVPGQLASFSEFMGVSLPSTPLLINFSLWPATVIMIHLA